MRKPVFLSDIDRLGEWFWVEVEGYDTMIKRQSGNFGGVEKYILGWDDVKTLGDILRKEKEVNYAPRVRYWRGEDEPTAEERAAGRWEDDSRLWTPGITYLDDREKWREFLETGRTQWPQPPDPDDPVALNREKYIMGYEPYAPMCAGCHFGKWQRATDKRWRKTAAGGRVFLPCTNIGVDGWKWWNDHQTQPESCEGYCRIGEHRPSGFGLEMGKVIRALEGMEV